jgi:hypothetical protein
LDCIADLLQRDDEERLVQVAAFFESVSYQNLREEELLVHVRRLVYGRVNQSLFRLYNELDPSLGKVLRNLKLAVQSIRTIDAIDRLGEQYIAPSHCETLEELPALDQGALEAKVREFFYESRQMPQLVAKLAGFLRRQSEHSRCVSVMSLAVAVRAIYAGDNEAPAPDQELQERLHAEDTARIISEACRKVSQESQQLYVVKKRIDPRVYAHYFQVIETNIHRRILGEDGEAGSYFEGLRSLMPELTQEEYREAHRARLEYLGRLSFDEAREQLKKHMI